MLTVKRFLELSPFYELKILSGHNGLDNIITSGNIMDNPDAIDWFSVGELLLTSGYFFKDSPELQNNIMKQLKDLNCPALCIKPRRYLGTVPENMLKLSDELDLPIIEVPYGLSFSKILGRIMEELSDKYDSLNKKSLDIHSRFFNISLHGGGLYQISVTLSDICSSSVMLLDKNWTVLHWTDHPKQTHLMSEYISLKRKEIPFSDDFIRSFPPEFERLQKPVMRHMSISKFNASIPCTVIPVYFQSKHYGYIVLWNPLSALNEYSYIGLENGAMAFSLERIRSDELTRTRNRIRRDFLDELLMGKITSKETLSNLADLHGINLDLYYTAVVFPVSFLNTNKNLDIVRRNQWENTKVKQVLNHFDQLASISPQVEILFSRKKQIILLLGFSNDNELNQIKLLRQYIQEKLDDVLSNFTEISLYATIGKTATHMSDIHESFHQAQETLRLSEHSLSTHLNNRIFHFDEFLLQYFLLENIEKDTMKNYFKQTLGPLHDHDLNNGSALIETLISLVSHRFNIAECSRDLFIHRNTLLYRIEKIESILLVNLKDAEESLKLQLGLKIYQLLDL